MLSLGFLIFLLVFAFALAVMMVNVYNGLIRLRNQVERAWANIDVILKQRFDEIPQLVQVVEQYAGYEAGVLKQLADARAHYGQARNVGEKIEASQEMSLALRGLFALSESYPELKANTNFVQLQERVSALENTLADRRESYNEVISNFNTRIDQFPDVFAARMLNYQRQEMFQVPEAEKMKPSLKMNMPQLSRGA